MVANILTKGLAQQQFSFLREKTGMVPQLTGTIDTICGDEVMLTRYIVRLCAELIKGQTRQSSTGKRAQVTKQFSVTHCDIDGYNCVRPTL